jgi:hypothetical protein
MRKRIILFLQWLIWVFEGKAGAYYRKEWEIFWTFTLPRIVLKLRLMFGYRTFARAFNTIDVCVMYDPGKIINSAIERNNAERRFRNWKKAHLSVERWVKQNRGTRLPDIEGEECLHSEAKLTREEKAYADGLYKQLSFGRARECFGG